MSDTTSGRYDPWERHGGINGGGSRGNAPAELERVRLRTHLAEFESLLEIARKRSPRQHRNLWLVPVLHRLAHLAEQMEAIRLATLGKTESGRYSPPDPFVANDLFGLLRSGGGEGGGALVLAAVCRFFCSVAMLPADAGTRTAPAPPITTILSEEPGLFENVLSWVRGEVPPTAVNPPDTAATAAAIEKGRETVRRNKAKVEKEAKVEGSSSSGVGRISMGLGEVVVAKEEETVAREMKAARAAAAAAELRVHATGLLSAGMFSRSLNDVAVHRGLAADLVSRLREGPVANHLRVEAARGRREQQRGTSLVVATTAASTATAAATAVQEEKTGNGTGGEEVSREESRPERQARPVRSGNGRGEGGTNAAPEALSGSEWGWGRWPSMAAAEAEHVTACVSGVGSYQEILAPLFSGDDLAVVDLLLAQPELEMRLHAVELVSALLFHKKVGMAFVRRGWMKDLLRLGAMEDAAFIEPELAFCLQNFAASGGVMEAVCRVQDGSLERLLEYAAMLLRSPSEATQKNILAFWEAAIRYPPALEAFEQHGAMSKLLYLLLPVTPGHSEGNNGGASASGGRSRSGSFGSSRTAESQSHSPRRRRWGQIAESSSGSGGGGASTGSGIGPVGARDHAQPALAQRRAEVTLRVCVCLRQYLRCSLALAVLKQTQRAGGRSAGELIGGGGRHHQGHHNHAGRGGSSGGGSSPVAGAAATEAAPTPSTMPGRSTGRQAWGFKPLAVDDVNHATNVALVKGDGLGSVVGRLLAGGYGWIGGGALAGAGGEAPGPWGGRQGKAGGEGVAVRLGMHWPPAVQLVHHRGVQALINVVEATSTQRNMSADTAQQALDALGTAALCPLVYPELRRPGSNSSTSDARPTPSQTPPQGGGGASASPGSIGRGGPAGRSRSDTGTASEGGNSAAATVGSDAVVVGGWTLPHNRLGVDVLLDAAGGVRQRDGGVMCAALRVLETCCRPHRGCGPLVPQEQEKQPLPRTATVTDTDNAGGAAAAAAEARSSAPGGGDGRGGSGRRAGVDSDNRTVDDRLQRPMRKSIRERNGIRVLVGLLRYRKQAAVADAVRLRAALCLLGLAHDPQIAQMLEKMRITTTLSDTVRSGAVGRNVGAYSQLREVAKQIISRVAGRLSSTVGKSGLMDPAVTGLERAAVVANTPITFRPKELLGIIHEYLAVNGLSGAAEALAAEAELSTPPRQRHASRRICVGASPEGNYHVSSRPGGGNSRRRRVYQDGKVNRGGGGGGVDVNAPGLSTGRSTTGGNVLPARVGDKRNARGAARRLSTAAEEVVETEESEGIRRKKRRVPSVTGEKGAPSTTVSGIPAGNTPTTADGAIADPAAATDDPSEVSTAAVITTPQPPPQPSLIGRSKTAAAFASPSYFGPPRKASFSSRAPREDRDVGTDARTVRQAASRSGGGAGGCNKTPTHPRRSPPLGSLKGGGGGGGGSAAHARGRLVSGASPSSSSSSRPSGTRSLPWTPSFSLAATRGKRPLRGVGTVAGGGASFVGGDGGEGKDLERQRATVGSPRGLFSGVSDEQGGVDQNGGFSSGGGSGDFSLDVVRCWDHRNLATCWGGGDAVAGEMMLLGDGMGSGGGGGGYGMVPSGGATALDEIVTTFLLNQHERCPDPVCVLPPLSLLEPHRCPGRTPAGAMGTSAPPNVAKRAALARQAVPPLGGRGGARLQRAFVHSRFRRHRTIQDPDHVITASAFAMRPGSASRLWVGTRSGVVRLWSTFSMEVEGRWRVSQHSVNNIEQHPGDRFARGGASASSPLLLSSVGIKASEGEVLLWRALGNSVQEDPIDQEEQPLFRWPELRAARFDHGGTRVACVLYPHSGGHSSVLAAGQHNDRQAWGTQILDVETGSVLARLWDARSPPLYPRPNVAFNATDDLVATDGALWDPRRGTRVHQFDKLGSGCGYGLFHPNGNDVLVDEGVWDLRTHRLVRTLPSQDGALMRPSTGGEVLYTYRPFSGGDFDTCFGVLDASSYEQIHSHDTEKAILQLTTDEWDCDGSYISVVERDPLLSSTENVCTLYEVGRKRPDDGDSDFDDAMSEESDEEWEDAEDSDEGPNLDQELILGGADYSDSDSDSVDLDDLIEMDSSGDDLGGQGGDGGGAGSHDRDDPGIIFRGGRPGVFGRRHGGVSRAGGERPNRRVIVVGQQPRRHLDDDDDDDDDEYEAEDNDEEDDEGEGNEENDGEGEDDE